MTPELIELARAAMALPGAPEWRRWNGNTAERRPDGELIGFRVNGGIRWYRDGDGEHEEDFVWDLTDPATGGVLVSMLGFEARRVRATASMHKHAAGYRWGAEMPFETFPILCHYQAEAACRVAVDIGGWK